MRMDCSSEGGRCARKLSGSQGCTVFSPQSINRLKCNRQQTMDSTNKNRAFKPFRAQSEFEDGVAKGDVLSGAFLFSALPDVQERNPVGVSIWSDLDRVATRHDVPANC